MQLVSCLRRPCSLQEHSIELVNSSRWIRPTLKEDGPRTLKSANGPGSISSMWTRRKRRRQQRRSKRMYTNFTSSRRHEAPALAVHQSSIEPKSNALALIDIERTTRQDREASLEGRRRQAQIEAKGSLDRDQARTARLPEIALWTLQPSDKFDVTPGVSILCVLASLRCSLCHCLRALGEIQAW